MHTILPPAIELGSLKLRQNKNACQTAGNFNQPLCFHGRMRCGVVE